MKSNIKTKYKWPWYESSNIAATRILLFLIWPFGAWITALKHANKKASFVIFFLFDMLLLWHMSPTGYGNGYHDFLGIMERFQINNISWNELLYELHAFLTFSEDAPKEIYEDILTWIVKNLLSDNYHIYFLLASIPVAYCQLNILYRIINDTRSKMCFALLTVMILIIIPRDIIGTQNPRFTTGFWVCAMSSIAYYTSGHKLIYIILVLISPIFHSGMWPFVLIFLGGLILRKCEKPLEVAAFVSIPFIFIDADLFRSIDYDFLPSFLSGWVTRYMSDEKYALLVTHEGRSGFWWVDSLFIISQKVIYIYMTMKIIKNKVIVKQNPESANIYSFYLLVFAVVNMIQFVPELGNRYYGFLRVFCVFVWFKAFYPFNNKILYILLASTSWYMFNRYGYILGGALSVNTPIDIFVMPLPYLMGKGLIW